MPFVPHSPAYASMSSRTARLSPAEFDRTQAALASTTTLAETASSTAAAASSTASAASAVAALAVPRGELVLNPRNAPYNAVGNGVADDTAALQSWINDLIGGVPSGAISTSRFAQASGFLPAGSYKITAPLKIYGVFGLRIYGVGIESKFMVSGNLACGLDLNGVRYSVFENFSVQGILVADTANDGIAINWSTAVSQGSTYHNEFRNVRVFNLTFQRSGFGVGCDSADRDVSAQKFFNCGVFGNRPFSDRTTGELTNYQGGFVSGSGVHGNVLNHYYYGCGASKVAVGYFGNACDITLYGASSSLNGTDLYQVGNRRYAVVGFRTENCARLFEQAGYAHYSSHATLQDIQVGHEAGYWAADGKMIRIGYGGNINLNNIRIEADHSTSPVLVPVIESFTQRSVGINVNGFTCTTGLGSLFVGSGPATINVANYKQLDTNSEVIASYPMWTNNINTVSGDTLPTFNNGVTLGTTKVLSGSGSPETVVTGSPGDMYLRYGTPPGIYIKQTGTNTATGWGSVAATPLGGLTTLVSDNFDRADATNGLGTSDTLQAWTTITGSWGISGNQAYSPTHSGSDRAWIDAGVSDCTITCKIVTMTSDVGILARVLPDATAPRYSSGFYTSPNQLIRYSSTGLVAVTPVWSPAIASGDTVQLVLNGSTIQVYVDYGSTGTYTRKATVTDTMNVAETKHGLRSSDTSATVRFDNFLIQA